MLPEIFDRVRQKEISHFRKAHLVFQRTDPRAAPWFADPAGLAAFFTALLTARLTARATREQVPRLLPIDLCFHHIRHFETPQGLQAQPPNQHLCVFAVAIGHCCCPPDQIGHA